MAFLPPCSGGHPGTSQPLSKSLRCQRRAHSGMWAEDRTLSARSSADGRCSSNHSRTLEPEGLGLFVVVESHRRIVPGP